MKKQKRCKKGTASIVMENGGKRACRHRNICFSESTRKKDSYGHVTKSHRSGQVLISNQLCRNGVHNCVEPMKASTSVKIRWGLEFG